MTISPDQGRTIIRALSLARSLAYEKHELTSHIEGAEEELEANLDEIQKAHYAVMSPRK